MKIVQPIRDKNKINEMKIELRKKGTRDYLLFVTGINTGLRISDIIKLKVSDVLNADRTVKSHITIIEQKTNKLKKFKINDTLAREFLEYTKNMKMSDYLFTSRKGINKPITRVQAYRLLNTVALKIELEEIGTHTLRKTFGYHFYKKSKDVAMLQKLFNHSSPSITLRYIGIEQDEIDEAYSDFEI
ncbi:MAG: site-specific integrase [Bacilli bacterium]|nr:site-specific integrase [Bacilli bacterium]